MPEVSKPKPGQADLDYAMAVAVAVAKGVRFPDADARHDCTVESAIYTARQLGKFEPGKGTQLRTFAYLVCRRRMIQCLGREMRQRMYCYSRPDPRPRKPPAPLAGVIICEGCRAQVRGVLQRQSQIAASADGELGAWLRAVLSAQSACLLGTADVTSAKVVEADHENDTGSRKKVSKRPRPIS